MLEYWNSGLKDWWKYGLLKGKMKVQVIISFTLPTSPDSRRTFIP